jgi:DNA-binding NarL/FixJ family response regulator
MISILLVDDQPMVRQGLRMRFSLEEDLTIVGEAGNAHQALELAQELKPDVVVMDLEMPEVDGISATLELHKLSPHLPIVILSLYDDFHTRTQAHRAGATAFVEKRGGSSHLLKAIREAVR